MRRLERAGISRSVAMNITGHKTESVYRRYAIMAEADLEQAVARLESAETVPEQSQNRRREGTAQ